MSYYSKYNFVSPEPIYAIVKEELKSYFDTGAVDDLLFPTYLNKCLEKLGKATHAIVPVILFIEDFTCRLPDNFYAVREAWVCNQTFQGTYTTPSAFYSQATCVDTIQVTPLTVSGECYNPVCQEDRCSGECMPEVIQAVYKTTMEIPRQAIRRSYLLKPGNISFHSDCTYSYNTETSLYNPLPVRGGVPETPYSAIFDSFDLRDNKFVTTFRTGIVELLMYASDYDCLGSQLIPDNYRVKEFIEHFLKFKVFETISNQTNDETFNQVQQKMFNYKQMADEAYIMAETEIKKQDAYAKQRRIRKLNNSLDRYELPLGYGRRRRRNY